MVASVFSDKKFVAYFSMEIALESDMPSYSGGLGVLAGDTLRAAADLGLPMYAVSLLYRKGYFRQTIDENGKQHEETVNWIPETWLKPVAEKTSIEIEGQKVAVKAWRYDIKGETGHTLPVYFLDTDVPENSPEMKALTENLYGGDEHYRLGQETLLGIGGVQMLKALGYAPEFAKALGVEGAETIKAGQAIAWCYGGLVVGDIFSGLLSQYLQSRKKVMAIFLALNLLMVFIYLNAHGISGSLFYLLCMGMGFSVGYWVIFVTIAAEQFGTNIRATVTTTVPNFVRGSLPGIILMYQFFRDKTFAGNILEAGMLVGTILAVISFVSLWKMKETFHANLDYTEPL